MIPEDIVQKVIDTADIVEVIGDFVNLHKAGVNYKGLCPFHNEKTPSFVVSPSKQIFKCFGCGESGTVVSFIMKHEHLSFPEAVKWLAKKYNIHIEEKELSAEELQRIKETEAIDVLNTFATKHFINNLHNTEEGRNIGLSYFKHRGFTDETIKKFQLGYAPDKRNNLLNAALEKGYKTELLLKAGLISEKEGNIFGKNRFYDRFRARVMFPIHSISGRVIGFGGRILSNEKKTAKYLNTPETPVYHKSKSLYGLYFAKNEIVRQDKCYLVEGYTDVISLHQAGITNVVASSGTSLTEDQIRIIHRFTENLTLIFDGDAAGIKAGLRGLDMVLKENMNVRIIALPKDEDPDSFSKKMPASELKEYLENNEIDFILFKIKLLKDAELTDPIKKRKAIQNILNSISVIPDQLKRSEYLKETANLLDIEEEKLHIEVNDLLNKELSKQKKKEKQATKKAESKQTEQSGGFLTEEIPPEEHELTELLLKYGNQELEVYDEPDSEPYKITVAEYIITEIESDGGFSHQGYQKIFELFEKSLNDNVTLDLNSLINHEDDEIREISTKIFSKDYVISQFWRKNGEFVPMPEETFREDVKKAVITFKLRKINSFLKKLNQELQNPTLPEEARLSKMQISQRAIQMRNHLRELSGNRNIYRL